MLSGFFCSLLSLFGAHSNYISAVNQASVRTLLEREEKVPEAMLPSRFYCIAEYHMYHKSS